MGWTVIIDLSLDRGTAPASSQTLALGGGGRTHTLTRSGGGNFWTRPKACQEVPAWGFRGQSSPDAEVFKSFCKKSMKITIFRPIFENLMKILRFLEIFLKNFSNFSRKFGQKFRSMHL